MVPKIACGTTALVHQELVHNHIGRVAVLVHASLIRVRIHRCNLDFGTGARAASRNFVCVCVLEERVTKPSINITDSEIGRN